jgi:hypothetical protein
MVNAEIKIISYMRIEIVLVLMALFLADTYSTIQAQDIAPETISGRVVKLTYTSGPYTNYEQYGPFGIAAYDATTFQLLAGPSTGLTGSYSYSKTGTNTSLTVLNFVVGGSPVVRSNQSIYFTPQTGTFTYTVTITGQPRPGGAGFFEEVLYTRIRSQSDGLHLSWLGGRPPYQVQVVTNLGYSQWTPLQTVSTNELLVHAVAASCLFRVVGNSTSGP